MVSREPSPNGQPDEPEHSTKGVRCKSSYHLLCSKNKLPSYTGKISSFLRKYHLSRRPGRQSELQQTIEQVKKQLILELSKTGGDVGTIVFNDLLEDLLSLYDPSCFDERAIHCRKPRKEQHHLESTLEGMWISLSKPEFVDCIGRNDNGDYMYDLGSISFGMFCPSKVVCSIQGIFNNVNIIDSQNKNNITDDAPKSVRQVLEKSNSAVLLSYQNVTAFCIEPWNADFGTASPNKEVDHPVHGVLTTNSYALADPDTPGRLTIWFTGSAIELDNDKSNGDVRIWHQVFEDAASHNLMEKLRLIVTRLAVGATIPNQMEANGRMSYSLSSAMYGNETASIDLLYLDETLRILRSNTGSINVLARVPHFPDERDGILE